MSFFIADGIQTVANGALRGLNDTRVPLLFSAHQLLGHRLHDLLCPGVLGRAGARSACGSGLSLALAVYAGLLIWRFHALSREGYLPELPPGA